MAHPEADLIRALREVAQPLTGASQDYDALLERIGEARFVLIGEAPHGTHEFYRERARLTRRLIEEKGFTAVAVEADWPDAYRVNRYVRGGSDDGSAQEALGDFQRFPKWMWRNEDVQNFVEWLRDHNGRHPGKEVGFYGLDLYSLHRSMRAVIEYLEGVDPEARGGHARGTPASSSSGKTRRRTATPPSTGTANPARTPPCSNCWNSSGERRS